MCLLRNLGKKKRKNRGENRVRKQKTSEAKDPAIKLFGKTIPLPEKSPKAAAAATTTRPADFCVTCGDDNNNSSNNIDKDQDPCCSTNSSPEESKGEDGDAEKDSVGDKRTDFEREVGESKEDDGAPPVTSGESSNLETISGASDNPKTPSDQKERTALKTSKTEGDQSETSNPQEKPLKKPDKILPCPRCNSMDTSFVTTTITMSINPDTFARTARDTGPLNARADIPNGVHHPALKANGTVLTFGSDTRLCESMASVLNLADKTMHNTARNGFHKPEELKIPVSYRGGENGVEHSNGSSAPTSKDEAGKAVPQDQMMENCQGFPPQVQCFPGAPWPYPWNSAQWSSPVPPPAFCPPGFPMPFYPAAAYWGCTVSGTWNVPWLPQLSSPKQTGSSSGPNSPTLGKHSRDENTGKPSNSGEEEPVKENNAERCLWIPKTLRIDDPGEAARSSIWATRGVNEPNRTEF
ncbi:hypothetical protein PTKIN_Ptkin08bG0013000 [Pterospermum kingtungense]